jgi:hypothetical protein
MGVRFWSDINSKTTYWSGYARVSKLREGKRGGQISLLPAQARPNQFGRAAHPAVGEGKVGRGQVEAIHDQKLACEKTRQPFTASVFIACPNELVFWAGMSISVTLETSR